MNNIVTEDLNAYMEHLFPFKILKNFVLTSYQLLPLPS